MAKGLQKSSFFSQFFALIFQAQLQKRHPVQQAQPNPADRVTKPPIRVTRIPRKCRKSPNPEAEVTRKCHRKSPTLTHFRRTTPNTLTTPLAPFPPIGKKLIRIRASHTSSIIILVRIFKFYFKYSLNFLLQKLSK